jgi:hypothetical protein
LFVISYIGVFLGSAITAPLLGAADSLARINANSSTLVLGVLIELLNDIAVVGIAALLFPYLKREHEGLAVAYVGLRILEAGAHVFGEFSKLTLIPISRQYMAQRGDSAAQLDVLASVNAGAVVQADMLVLVFFACGALVLYYLLFRSRLVPRFIAVWGWVAIAMVVAVNVIGMPGFDEGFSALQLLAFPIILNELFLAFWLLVRGFRRPVVA